LGIVLVLADRQRIAWPLAACLLLAWVLLGQGDRFSFYDETLRGPFWQLVLSYKTYGLLLLYGVLVGLRRAGSGAAQAI
jgi:hypothetical protein